jgi:hypothetical protein
MRRDFCAIFQVHGTLAARKISNVLSNLWEASSTYRYWGFQRPISKRTPPSDDIPPARRRAFHADKSTARPSQLDAYQPAGKGTSGQTISLSFAASGSSSTACSTIGADGGHATAICKRGHCKFMLTKFMSIGPGQQASLKFEFGSKSSRASKRRVHLKSHAYSR